jgi:hypothetical protein
LVDYLTEVVRPAFVEIAWYRRFMPFDEQMKAGYQRDHIWSFCMYWLDKSAQQAMPHLKPLDREKLIAACLVAGELHKDSDDVVSIVHQRLHQVKKWMKEQRDKAGPDSGIAML